MNDDGCSINDGNQYSDKNDMDKNIQESYHKLFEKETDNWSCRVENGDLWWER